MNFATNLSSLPLMLLTQTCVLFWVNFTYNSDNEAQNQINCPESKQNSAPDKDKPNLAPKH